MKEYYNARYEPRFFAVGDLVNLRLHRGYMVPNDMPYKIGPQLAGPFRVIKQVGCLAYRLELPEVIRIHNIISIAHLEPATDPTQDPYDRIRPPPEAVVIDGE